jgi:hypothetical protein
MGASRKMSLHVASQHGVDSGLIAFLLSKPFEKVSVEADRDGLLRSRHDHSRALPEIDIGRLSIGIGFESSY